LIVNASPLIIFGKLNKIDILKKIYTHIEITNSVYQEVVVNGIKINSRDAFIVKNYVDNRYIKIIKLNNVYKDKAKKIQTIYTIDIGEAETIALALQLNRKEVMIDEMAAREAAKSAGVKPIGSLRVLLLAYKAGLIDKDDIKKMIYGMESSKYRFSPQVLIEFWDLFEKMEK
jgi:uncharacterized protein